jgi:hypothetical protein
MVNGAILELTNTNHEVTNNTTQTIHTNIYVKS